MPVHGIGEPRVRVAVVAQRPQAALTEEAVAARDRKRHNHLVAHRQFVADALAHLDHFAHELVAQNVAALHRGNEAVVQVQVAAANGGRGDFDDRVTGVQDLGVGNLGHAHIVFAVPAKRFHAFLASSAFRSCSICSALGTCVCRWFLSSLWMLTSLLVVFVDLFVLQAVFVRGVVAVRLRTRSRRDCARGFRVHARSDARSRAWPRSFCLCARRLFSSDRDYLA